MHPLSLNLHTLIFSNSKPKITWNNLFSVSNQNVKTLKLNKKIIRFTHPQPAVRKLSSSTEDAHTQLMTGIIFIKKADRAESKNEA